MLQMIRIARSWRRQLRRDAVAAVVCFGIFALAGAASADPVAFAFEGIQNTGAAHISDSPDGAIAALFSEGDTISGQFIFESSATGSGGYFPGALSSFSFSVNGGSYGGSSADGDIDFLDNWFVVRLMPGNGIVAPYVGENSPFLFSVEVSSTGILYGDGSLPTVPPPVSSADNFGSNWDRVQLLFMSPSGAVSGVNFALTSLTAVPVPEPGCLLLVGLGLALVAGYRARA